MGYDVQPYDEEGTVYEAVNDGTPEFYGTLEECVAYIDSVSNRQK
jgi:hypothetical protein